MDKSKKEFLNGVAEDSTKFLAKTARDWVVAMIFGFVLLAVGITASIVTHYKIYLIIASIVFIVVEVLSFLYKKWEKYIFYYSKFEKIVDNFSPCIIGKDQAKYSLFNLMNIAGGSSEIENLKFINHGINITIRWYSSYKNRIRNMKVSSLTETAEEFNDLFVRLQQLVETGGHFLVCSF